MATWHSHKALAPLQARFFPYTWEMFPSEFKNYYLDLPIELHTGVIKYANVHQYISSPTESRTKNYHAFRSAAMKWYKDKGRDIEHDWLKNNHVRVMACFYGQALPEELSLVCRMMVETGQRAANEVADWASKNFGLDCCGFVSSYFTALGTFDGRVYYIPKYREIGGTAKTIKDISYDCAILFARPKLKKVDGKLVESGDWETRPNPGNSAHIMVIDGWHEYGKSLIVTQSGSSLGGLDTGVYDIVKAPTSDKASRCVWTIRRSGGGSKHEVFITREMPFWSEA